MDRRFSRVFCIVLDGVGAGEAPDAADFGDVGTSSLSNTARAVGGLRLPRLEAMGLGRLSAIDGVPPCANPRAHFGVMSPAAAGKDSTVGHWELMGCTVGRPFPTYPDGFPPDVVSAFERLTGREVIGNVAASGTWIIQRFGDRHVATGSLIVYTSQDSVFQVAAHEDVVPVETLYAYCEAARVALVPPNGVGRVIARPFFGEAGGYYRTPRRRDFSLPPPSPTVLDRLQCAGVRVDTIGKIDDLFAGRGIDNAIHTRDNREGMERVLDAAASAPPRALVFANLVDFDTMWGHRNDARAYALGLEEFDAFLAEFLDRLASDDLLLITSDHGNDPTAGGTDHSRELVPLLAYHANITTGSELGVRRTFADLGATILDVFGVAPLGSTTERSSGGGRDPAETARGISFSSLL